ncbi:hypothetical protein NM208_g3491 [Fusarium decemcellulare]|uniref:Uncharacterized protein n=1 Tax=Fusarium decemcellulare TaxID=57161 RepID=A0ACC1SP33_9HYPO|nr:hypothetical protein NM208_g3491 [Fusarium decemcellulare]
MVEHQEDANDPRSVERVPEKDEERYVAPDDVLKGAQQATDAEHSMKLMEGLRKYPKACAWSLLFSSALIMEGFDKAFVTSFFAFPPFQERYGELQSTGDYQVPADIQAAISNCVNVDWDTAG